MIRLAASHPEWALGFEDEVWWNRSEQPSMHPWGPDAEPLHLIERPVAKADKDPKALACYGLLVRLRNTNCSIEEQMWLRFVEGRPVGAISM